MRKIKRLARGVHYWETRGGRIILRLHYASIPDHDNDEWRAIEQDRINCGPGTPEWQTEYEINPDARKGILVYPDWDESIHVGTVTPRSNGPWYQVAGIDYGTRAPTAIMLGSWNGLWLRLWHEHYFSGRHSVWHKGEVARVLGAYFGFPADSETIFEDALPWTFSDPTAMLDLEYMHEPQPWVHTGSIGSKRLNNVASGEDAVHNFLQRRGACCGMMLFQTSSICDSKGRYWAQCPKCHGKARLRVGLRADRSCVQFRHQMRTLRIPKPKEGEAVDDKKKPKQDDHATDAGRYLCHGLSELLDPTVIKKPKVVEKYQGTRYHLPKGRSRKRAVERAYCEG